MPKIVGKDQSIYKRITCKHCASIIEYLPVEVKVLRTTDYAGGVDVREYIACPKCCREVVIKAW